MYVYIMIRDVEIKSTENERKKKRNKYTLIIRDSSNLFDLFYLDKYKDNKKKNWVTQMHHYYL